MEPFQELLPLFPLNMVLFPEESVPLHIFEPRYKLMIADCERTKSPFGLILSLDEKLAQVGCTAKIVRRLQEHEDGSFDIMVMGLNKFQMNEIVDGEAYMRIEPTWLEDDTSDIDSNKMERLITQHMRLLELAGRTVRPALYQDVVHVSYVIGRNAGLNLEQKQMLLELLSENDRIAFLVEHMARFIPEIEEIESVRQKVQSNGHFQDFPPEV